MKHLANVASLDYRANIESQHLRCSFYFIFRQFEEFGKIRDVYAVSNESSLVSDTKYGMKTGSDKYI